MTYGGRKDGQVRSMRLERDERALRWIVVWNCVGKDDA